MLTWNPDAIVVVSKNQMASSLGGETVILGMTKGRYYGVGEVGARVWQLIQTPTRLDELKRTIVSEYDVTPERCEADLLQLLEKMLAEGLVEVRPAPAS